MLRAANLLLMIGCVAFALGCRQGEVTEGGRATAPTSDAGETATTDAGQPPPANGSSSGSGSGSSSGGGSSECPPGPADFDAGPVTPTTATGESVVTIASGQPTPYYLAINQAGVYWLGNTVMMAPLDGGAPTTLSGVGNGGIAADSANVYFVGFPDVFEVPLDGGPGGSLGTGVTNDSITVGASAVFGTYGNSGGMTLVAVPLDGSGTRTLAQTSAPSNCYGLASDSESVYWSNFAGSAPIMRTPIDGGPSTVLAMGSIVFGVAVDATYVYWAETGSGNIWRVRKCGGPATTVATGITGANQIALDDKNLYVTTGLHDPSGGVARVAKDGSAVTYLATGFQQPWGIAVDDTSVYFTTVGPDGAQNAGSVVKVTPK
ncbi:MAG TPA: hypothetical protein VF765_04670 [Polyangiaceae bacterium]